MKNSPSKPWYKRWTAWAIIIVALGIIGNLLPDQSADKAEPAANAEVPRYTQTKSDDEVAADKANEKAAAAKPSEVETKPAATKPVQAEKPATKPATLADAVNGYLGDRRIHGQSVKDGYYTVETDFGDFIGPEYCEEESIDLAQLISEHPDYAATGANGVKVVYISGVTDAYGNSADETVMYIEYSNETIARINFDTFDPDNVVAVADDYFRMASFK